MIVYRIFDPIDKHFEWFGDVDDIIFWLEENQISQLDITKKELREKGWVWGLEKAGVTFEEVYNKELEND